MNIKFKFTALVTLILPLFLIYFFQLNAERILLEKVSKSLDQNIEYGSKELNIKGERLTIIDVEVNSKVDERFTSVRAQKLAISLDYPNLMRRSVIVKNVEASYVTIYLDYKSIGHSNLHEIQYAIRDYIKKRKADNKDKVLWDVSKISLRNVNLVVSDFDLGHIGVFSFDSINLPHFSSDYTKEENKDVLVRALFDEVVSQVLSGEVQGEYNSKLLGILIAREGKVKIENSVKDKFEIWTSKAKKLINRT